MSHCKLSLFKRLKACWLIITNKEFYLEVITSRYDNGEELSATVISYIWNTETAVKRLKNGLNIALKIIKDEKKNL
ncbi:MAG: hypothetical protein K6F74_05335 [Prevotella sp.]|nr:hypothetical protein [Prevotella sp.]